MNGCQENFTTFFGVGFTPIWGFPRYPIADSLATETTISSMLNSLSDSGCGAKRFPAAANYLSSDVQCAHLVAFMGTVDKQCGQSFVVGAAAGSAAGRCRRLICLINMKIAKAMIKKLIT